MKCVTFFDKNSLLIRDKNIVLLTLNPDKQKKIFFMDVNNLAKLFSASKEDFQFLKLINKLIEGSLKLRNGNLSVLEKYSKMAVYHLESSDNYYLED